MDPDGVPLVKCVLRSKSNLLLYVGKAFISQYFQVCANISRVFTDLDLLGNTWYLACIPCIYTLYDVMGIIYSYVSYLFNKLGTRLLYMA
jgi:hypothetical protein